MNTLLLIDDEPGVLEGQSKLLRLNGYQSIRTARSIPDAKGVCQREEIALAVLDLRLGDESGLELLEWLREHTPDTVIVVVTGASEISVAVRCMQAGAHDFLVKSTDSNRLVTAVRNGLEHRSVVRENDRLREALVKPVLTGNGPFAQFTTNSERMHRIFIYLEAVAPLPDPVLITGETGVGKEVVARAVHQASGFDGPFVPVNLGGLDDHVVSDTLFGHDRGSFTGADKARAGLIRAAAGGTLFLDEFAELTPESQTKLLRLLDSGEFMPLGSDRVEHSKARIVLATNRDIDSEISSGRFRKDLYFRIAAHRVHIPPLRERPEDVEPILSHLMRLHSKRLGHQALVPSSELLDDLRQTPLHGNVRELQQIVLTALVHGKWPQMESGTATGGAEVRYAEDGSEHTTSNGRLDGRRILFGRELPTPAEAVEELLREADRRNPNNRSAAAAAVGLSSQAFSNRWRRMADADAAVDDPNGD